MVDEFDLTKDSLDSYIIVRGRPEIIFHLTKDGDFHSWKKNAIFNFQ